EHSDLEAEQLSALRHRFRSAGASGYWAVRLKQALTQPAGKYVQPLYLSQLHLRCGQRELAFKALEQGFRVRDSWLVYLNQDPAFDEIRADPRFIALVRKVALP